MKIKYFKFSFLIVSAIIFFISLNQYVYYTNDDDSVGSVGLIALLFGWCGLFGAGISWLANPFLFISWTSLLFDEFRKSLVFSFLAFIISLSFLFFTEIIIDEAGNKGTISSYGIGYWLWISSCGLNFIGNLILYYNLKYDFKDLFIVK